MNSVKLDFIRSHGELEKERNKLQGQIEGMNFCAEQMWIYQFKNSGEIQVVFAPPVLPLLRHIHALLLHLFLMCVCVCVCVRLPDRGGGSGS